LIIPLRQLEDLPPVGSLLGSIEALGYYQLSGSMLFRFLRHRGFTGHSVGTLAIYLGRHRLYDGELLLVGMDMFIINTFTMLDSFALVQELQA